MPAFCLVKDLIDASSDRRIGKVYRFVRLPHVPQGQFVYQDRDRKLCEFIQMSGYDAGQEYWELLTLPALLGEDQQPQDLIAEAEKAGWKLDTGGCCVVDFTAKLEESHAIQQALSGDETPSKEGGEEGETWGLEFDGLQPGEE